MYLLSLKCNVDDSLNIIMSLHPNFISMERKYILETVSISRNKKSCTNVWT